MKLGPVRFYREAPWHGALSPGASAHRFEIFFLAGSYTRQDYSIRWKGHDERSPGAAVIL